MEVAHPGADPADRPLDPDSSSPAPAEPVLIRAERSMAWAWLLMILVVGAVFAADQFTKASVEQSLLLGEQRQVFTWLSVSHMQNTGLVFGFLADSDLPLDLFLGIAIVLLANMLMSGMREPVVWLPTGLILGGAMGNAVSRFRDGYVVDFIWVQEVPAVFNIADVAVVAGALVLVAVRLRNAYVAARWSATVQRLAESHGYGERSPERLETVG